MHWLFNARRLRQGGVLGINRRNAQCILERNPRSRFPVVDDKLLMADLCRRVGVPSPEIFGVLARHGEIGRLDSFLEGHTDFVMKPARGAGGRGVLVVTGRDGKQFRKANGRRLDLDGLRAHVSDILSGMFSLGGQPDRTLLQARVRPHPAFADIAPRGIADVRIVLYRFEPALAMLRLPTLASGGRANLHQGGLGVGVDLASGHTCHAVHGEHAIRRHPDTGAPLLNRVVPDWEAIVEMARKIARAVGLGFVGIDVVLDEREGPLLLEANARPGLAIQLANDAGLAAALDDIDRRLAARSE